MLRFSQNMTLQQRMAPQLIQSLQLLQMSTLELELEIQQQMELNPLLDDSDDGAEEVEEVEEVETEGLQAEAELPQEAEEVDWDALLDDQFDQSAYNNDATDLEFDPNREQDREPQENRITTMPPLAEQITDQLIVSDLKGKDVEIAEFIIGNLDDRGYLMYSLEEILDSMESPAPLILLEIALEIVQDLEPTGVGGRGIEECLLLQLKKDRQDYPLEERIIREFLSELGHNRLPKIARALGVGIEDLKDAVANIACLEPLPGKNYGGDLPLYVKPDVLVDEIEGKYVVRVDSDFMPRLRISAHYRELFRQSRKDPEVKKYLKKKLDNAEWLIAAIVQRQSTLQKIAQEIVNIQSDFLDHGISKLKPLKMADVAEIIGVHVSTISRGISGKYIQTPQGIFGLRSFFSGGATKSGGDVEARGSVIQRIKNFIAEEDKDRPLSDIAIVRKLEEVGISISRRTVTKYREAEGIPSSRERREY